MRPRPGASRGAHEVLDECRRVESRRGLGVLARAMSVGSGGASWAARTGGELIETG